MVLPKKRFLYIKKIPRVKDARDWLLTWSPPEDAHDLPEDIKKVIRTWPVSRGILVAEKEEKWHVHYLFSTSRSYNSDYKWWEPFFKEKNYGPALDIRYHNNFVVCAGGYLSKDAERNIIKIYNVSEAQLLWGSEEYDRRLARQKIRSFVDDLLVINPDKYDAAVGAVQAEQGCSSEEAEFHLARMGFAFSRSRPGREEYYRRMQLERIAVSEVPREDISPAL